MRKLHRKKIPEILGKVPDVPGMPPPPPFATRQQFAHIVERVERIRERQVASGRQIAGLCEGLMARAFAGQLPKGNA
jgi:hypothetical protein